MATELRVRAVLETSLYVDDLEAAEKYYTEVLGMKTSQRVEGRHVFIRLEHSMLLLFRARETEVKSGDVPVHGARGAGHVAFRMQHSEIDTWRERLISKGVAIETEVRWPNGGYSLYFRDPAGNSLELATADMWGIEIL